MSRFWSAWSVLPAVVLVGHFLLYGDWIVDDAGIVFAYARNWAEGLGLTAFPGEASVEGFTSPLSVAGFAALMRLGLFDPVWTPKLVGLGQMLAAFFLVRSAARISFPSAYRWIDAGLLAAALSPPLVVWAASGLENPLYALAVAILLRWTVRPGTNTFRDAIVAGLIAGLIPAIRPDGLVFAALWPLVILFGSGVGALRRFFLASAASTTTIACVGVLTLWRWAQFGDVVPNTFHVKGGDMGPDLVWAVGFVGAVALLVAIASRRPVMWGVVSAGGIAIYIWLEGLMGVPRALAGPFGPAVIAIVFTASAWGGRNPARIVWLVASLLGLLAFLALPGDWMGEYRFATPFLLITTVWVMAEFGPAIAFVRAPRLRNALVGLGVIACLLLLGRNVTHAFDYRARPALPFGSVEAHFLSTFSSWNEDLGLEYAKALVPDVGGALWTRTVRVRDLVGLCDRKIAKIPGGSDEMRDFILEELEPEFIRIHGPWAERSGLPGDARFEADYLCVHEIGDTGWGDFIRRELVTDEALIEKWRQASGD